jgi:hypothetical protein
MAHIRKIDLINAAGGVQAELGRKIGASRQAIYEWGDWVPELWVLRLPERAPSLWRKLKAEGKVHWTLPQQRKRARKGAR